MVNKLWYKQDEKGELYNTTNHQSRLNDRKYIQKFINLYCHNIFKFPEDYKASDPIKVYYGYKYASLPSYDTSGFPENSNQTLASLLVLEQKMNPDKSWSLFEPPISIWITRALFFFGHSWWRWSSVSPWCSRSRSGPCSAFSWTAARSFSISSRSASSSASTSIRCSPYRCSSSPARS